MSERAIRGIHHVTSMSGPAQRNVDFYVGELGLRMVKRTVNFDDPGTYHLYYGDQRGSPGSIMTFFPWPNAAPGVSGPGTIEATGFVVGSDSLAFWRDRLSEKGLRPRDIDLFGGTTLRFSDPDGMVIEISEDESAGVAADADAAASVGVGASGIDATRGIVSFSGVLLDVPDPEQSAAFLTEVFRYEAIGESHGRLRFRSPSGAPGSVVELRSTPSDRVALMGGGSVHHVAFRAKDEDEQLYWQEAVRAAGIAVTEVVDRQYFRSIYFREPGGVLFEIATDSPGFAWDESEETMGTALKLPPWLEARREEISSRLPVLVDPTRKAAENSQ